MKRKRSPGRLSVRESRVVVADHVLFDEAIAAFRGGGDSADSSVRPSAGAERLTAYVLLDFALPFDIDCGSFALKATARVMLPGAYAAFIAPLQLPPGLDRHSGGHSFAIAVSCILSFATARPAKSPRDPYLLGKALDVGAASELALQFPVLRAGPGCHDTHLSSQTLETYAKSICEIVTLLRALPDDEFVRVMRAMRLVQLAHNTVRDEFALAYYLLVSAIEIVATSAISRDAVRERHPQEAKWKIAAKADKTIRELLTAYCGERGKQRYLKKRFVQFVLQYCPPNEWSALEHPLSNLRAYLEEISPGLGHDHLVQKQWFELYPEDLPEPFVRSVLEDLYTYRSDFTHEGKAPPHRHPVSYNRYFDEQLEYDEEARSLRRLILPNYRLVAFIAQRAILRYGSERRPKTHRR